MRPEKLCTIILMGYTFAQYSLLHCRATIDYCGGVAI